MTPQAAGGKWRAHLVNVTAGLVNSHYVEIKSGLHEGDQVICEGYDTLREGDPVVPAEWGPQGPLTLPPATGEERAVPGTVYTCPMHPDVRSNKLGKCPKCGMDLVPMKVGVQALGRSGVQEGSSSSPNAPPQDSRPERLNAPTPARLNGGGSR